MKYLVVDDEPLILRDMQRLLERTLPGKPMVFATDDPEEALEIARRETPYVAFLDVQIPETNGIELSKKIQEVSPETNFVFVTAYSEHSMAAWRTEASAFLLKPVQKEDLLAALRKLRKPRKVAGMQRKLEVQCFGHFEAFFDGIPLRFQRRHSKEFLAYLVDRRGAEVTAGEIRTILWEEAEDTESKKSYVRTLASDIRKVLESVGLPDVFCHSRGAYSLDTSLLDCDYYHYLNGEPGEYTGSYMEQYPWAEETAAHLEAQQNNL